MPSVVAAGGLVLSKDRSQILLLKVPVKDSFVWTFPRTIVKSEEDSSQAALRAVHDELGVEAKLGQSLKSEETNDILTQWFVMQYNGVSMPTELFFFSKQDAAIAIAQGRRLRDHLEIMRDLGLLEQAFDQKTRLESLRVVFPSTYGHSTQQKNMNEKMKAIFNNPELLKSRK